MGAQDLRRIESEIKKYEATVFKGIWDCCTELVIDEEKIRVPISRLRQRINPAYLLTINNVGIHIAEHIASILDELKNLRIVGIIKTAGFIVNYSAQIVANTRTLVHEIQRLQHEHKDFFPLNSGPLKDTNQIIVYAMRMNKTAVRLNKLAKQI